MLESRGRRGPGLNRTHKSPSPSHLLIGPSKPAIIESDSGQILTSRDERVIVLMVVGAITLFNSHYVLIKWRSGWIELVSLVSYAFRYSLPCFRSNRHLHVALGTLSRFHVTTLSRIHVTTLSRCSCRLK